MFLGQEVLKSHMPLLASLMKVSLIKHTVCMRVSAPHHTVCMSIKYPSLEIPLYYGVVHLVEDNLLLTFK